MPTHLRIGCGFCLWLIIASVNPAVGAQESRWTELNAQVGSLYKQDRFADAIPLAEESVQIARQTFGADDPRTATSLANLALLNYAQGKHTEAVGLYQQAVTIRVKQFGPDHPVVAITLNELANVHRAARKYPEAEQLFKQVLAIREKAFGPNHLEVAVSLNNLGEIYGQQRKLIEAEALYRRAVGILEKLPGNVTLGITLNNLGLLYYRQGKYAEAEPRYQRALEVAEKIFGPTHFLVGRILHNLATLYSAQGKLPGAELRHKRALAILEKALGPDNPEVASSLNGLGVVDTEQAKYVEAESRYLRALAIREKALGANHPDVAESLNNLAMLHRLRGQDAEAEARYRQVLRIQEKELGPAHPDLAIALSNLAELYQVQGRMAEAEPLHQRALSIREKALGANHPDFAESLNNLGMLYLAAKNYTAAEKHFQRAVDIHERALGPTHPGVAPGLNNLAKVYQEQGKYAESERHYLRALTVEETVWGKDHPAVRNVLLNLGTLYYGWNQPVRAQPYFERGLRNLVRQLEQEFSYMTEKERLAFLETAKLEIPLFLSFCLTSRGQLPALTGQMYDAVLFQKGMVAAGVAATRAKIAVSGDQIAIRLFTTLTEKKRQLFRLTSTPAANGERWREEVARLEREAGALERDLIARSATFAEQRQATYPTWQSVRDRLKPGEASVEFVRFPFYDGQQWSSATQYVALVVTPASTTSPTLVSLGKAETLECGPLNEYSLRIQPLQRQGMPCVPGDGKSALALTPTLYQAFWKPLEPALAKATRVYVSLDGILNQVSLNVVPDESGTLLVDKYDLRVVLSTRDLLRDPTVTTDRSAVLIGNPLFTVDPSVHAAAARPYRTAVRGGDTEPGITNTSGRADVGLRGPPWDPLPGTKVELEEIARVLRAQRWTVTAHEGKDAVVESIKGVRSPRLLHVATHGEFAADPAEIRRETFALSGVDAPGQPSILNDPMLRSGLFFTGANRYRRGLSPLAGADDGVLTAFEASQLNLNGTELVVLSACKTGLGQSRQGEGVFGLRRAFQIAGAQAVMMTMWSVPDTETQMLMTRFYEKWTAGVDKHEALRTAQRELRKEYPDPSSWGAFVLVGR